MAPRMSAAVVLRRRPAAFSASGVRATRIVVIDIATSVTGPHAAAKASGRAPAKFEEPNVCPTSEGEPQSLQARP
jgi:hypothetical protein